MQSHLSRYILLARRWAWLVLLGAVICGGVTYVICMLVPPVYQASAILNINIDSSTSLSDNINASQLEATTYAQLLTSSAVLNAVLKKHPNLTFEQLSAMVSVKPEANTSLIELDVDNGDPAFAAELANEICQNFANYIQTQLTGTVKIVSAEKPSDPIRPRPLLYSGIGLLAGFCLGLALAIIFEWMDDRLATPEEAEKLLDMETMAVIHRLEGKQHIRDGEMITDLAEACRMICAALNAAQVAHSCKFVMFTSALPKEGKTTVAAGVASSLAKANQRVLLVDAHLRKPSLMQYFHLGNPEEISSSYLETWKQLTNGDGHQVDDLPTLQVLTPGGTPLFNAADLFLSPLAQQFLEDLETAPFDYVLFDSAPMLPVADAQILAVYMQVAVLVIDASKTSRKELQHTRRLLSKGHTKVLGAVINKSRWSRASASRYPTTLQRGAGHRSLSPVDIPPMNQLAESYVTTPSLSQVTKDE